MFIMFYIWEISNKEHTTWNDNITQFAVIILFYDQY